jgi:Fe-S cluster biosynthesis and repair protein YggX
MSEVTCTRCGKTGESLPAPPLPTDLGARILANICQSCWQEWLQQQTAIINHYGLNLLDPEARRMLTEQTETFLFGAPSEQPGE